MAQRVKPPAAPREVSPAQGLALAIQMHRQGRLDEAENLYRTLRSALPDDANVLHFYGILQSQRGRHDEALALIDRSIAIDGALAAWHNNRGNVLLEAGRPEQAADAYRRCTELDPDNLEVLNNLGVLYRHMGLLEDAERSLLQALQRNPRLPDAHANLGTLYVQCGRMDEALVHVAEALALADRSPRTMRLLGVAYAKLGRLDDAVRIYREWIAADPDDPQPRHLLAACAGTQVPERASDAYVQVEFDNFANSFDARLAQLDYRAPQYVGEEVAQLLGAPAARAAVLDAGCGTGLCAPWLRPHASRLDGVDLSPGMLAKARDRGQYDRLVQGELVAFLASTPASYDLVVSADTLCYFGRLEPAFAAARQALRAGGALVFTVEAHEDATGWRLQTHGRYSHAEAYLRTALAGAGFADCRLRRVVLRQENKQPVQGWVVQARTSLGATIAPMPE